MKKELINFFRLTILLALVCFIIYKLISESGVITETITCDAESIVEANGRQMFKSGAYFFDNTNCLQSKEARSGKNSVQLNESCPYGMTIELKDIKAGDLVEVSVSCLRKTFTEKNPVCIVAANPDFYIATDEKDIPTESCGWFRIVKKMRIPWTDKPVKFYCWSPGRDTVLVDDFQIVRPNMAILLEN